METKKVTLTLTDKEFEILRRAINIYTSEQLNKSETWGKEAEWEDASAVRARIALDIQHKMFVKAEARPELNHISLF